MNKHISAGLAAAVALAGSLALGAPAQADPPPADADRAPVAKAGTWLASQVPESGVFSVSYDFGSGPVAFPDPGLTIDGARALRETGGPAAVVTAMTDGVVRSLPGYYGGPAETYANAVGKAASFLQEQGRTGTELEAALSALRGAVSDRAPIAGRIEDQGGSFGDFATPLGQAYAVQALTEAAAPEAASVRDFLLAQQCEEGYFRGGFTADKTETDQSCDGAPEAQQGSSVDTTAFTILALQDLARTDAAVATALDEAATWLAGVQAADGSLTTGGTTGPANANSTGLAGWALGTEGDAGSAADAALWLRAHQLSNAGTCTPYAAADDGALVVDDLGLVNAQAGPMDDVDRGVALRATAQALPALAWAPGGDDDGLTALTATPGYLRAGSTQRVGISGPPGATLCLTAGSAAPRTAVLPASGRTAVSVELPATTGRTAVSVVDGIGRTTRVALNGLGAKRLTVRAGSKRVDQGRRVLVTATGLAPREEYKVLYRGRTVGTGTAGAQGKGVKRVFAAGRTGRAKVVVVGAFPDRRGSTSVTVVR